MSTREQDIERIAAAWHRAFHGWKGEVCPDDTKRATALYDAGLRAPAGTDLDVAQHAAMTGDPEDAWQVVRQVLGSRPHGFAAESENTEVKRCHCGEIEVNRVHHETRLRWYHPFRLTDTQLSGDGE